ncbi:hypothetical protein BD414DRAFT_476142 [Trametes punicea]|nr:hypothetical protein BD414DRAFT_476142 [Trametes punicea]
MSPDLRKKVDANRAARLARENATQQQAAAQVRWRSVFTLPGADGTELGQLNDPDAQKPIWADTSRS